MLSKKKMATIAATGMVTVGLLVGGASFALFTDTAANSGNSFKAGTLTLEQHRHDVPIDGPMFYQNNGDAGQLGTGLWAPRDSHTRAMFIKNTGSLDGKITKVTATPKLGSVAADVNNFADQAIVTIAVFESPSGTIYDDSVYEQAVKIQDRLFNEAMAYNGWFAGAVKEAARTGQRVFAQQIRDEILSWKFEVNGVGESLRVTDVYVGKLSNLLDGEEVLEELILKSGDTAHLGYTVVLADHPDNNLIKNKTVEFDFKQLFEQVRNND